MPNTIKRMTALDLSLAYVLVVGAALLVVNASLGGLIEGWYAEYAGRGGLGTGSGAWRGPERSGFQIFALLFGLWVYPLAAIAALGFAHRAWRSTSVPLRLRAAACAALALAILLSFVRLGVFGAVTHW